MMIQWKDSFDGDTKFSPQKISFEMLFDKYRVAELFLKLGQVEWR